MMYCNTVLAASDEDISKLSNAFSKYIKQELIDMTVTYELDDIIISDNNDRKSKFYLNNIDFYKNIVYGKKIKYRFICDRVQKKCQIELECGFDTDKVTGVIYFDEEYFYFDVPKLYDKKIYFKWEDKAEIYPDFEIDFMQKMVKQNNLVSNNMIVQKHHEELIDNIDYKSDIIKQSTKVGKKSLICTKYPVQYETLEQYESMIKELAFAHYLFIEHFSRVYKSKEGVEFAYDLDIYLDKYKELSMTDFYISRKGEQGEVKEKMNVIYNKPEDFEFINPLKQKCRNIFDGNAIESNPFEEFLENYQNVHIDYLKQEYEKKYGSKMSIEDVQLLYIWDRNFYYKGF